MKLSIGYSDSEDRIWLRTEGTNVLWWVSRRLALRLIEQWAMLLERTMPTDAPGGPADDERDAAAKAQAIAQRHVKAVEVTRGQKVAPVERPAPGVQLENRLLASVDLSIKDPVIGVELKAAGRSEKMMMTRDEAHRTLDALNARARRSGWYDAATPKWLAQPQQGGSQLAGQKAAGSGAPKVVLALDRRPPGRKSSE